jgi:hypothetical protein
MTKKKANDKSTKKPKDENIKKKTKETEENDLQSQLEVRFFILIETGITGSSEKVISGTRGKNRVNSRQVYRATAKCPGLGRG